MVEAIKSYKERMQEARAEARAKREGREGRVASPCRATVRNPKAGARRSQGRDQSEGR